MFRQERPVSPHNIQTFEFFFRVGFIVWIDSQSGVFFLFQQQHSFKNAIQIKFEQSMALIHILFDLKVALFQNKAVQTSNPSFLAWARSVLFVLIIIESVSP